MTTLFKFANFVATELEEGISAGATEMIIPVAASEDLPTLGVDEEIRLVLWDGQSDPEIVSVTDNPQTGVLTIERGMEDTTALSWEAGTQVRCTLTAEIINAALAAFFDLEDVLAQSFLPLTGGTVTGAITLPGDPVGGLDAATKGYVDDAAGGFLPTTGGTMAGNINMGSNQILGLAAPSVDSAAARKEYVDDAITAVQSQISAGAAAYGTSGTNAAYTITTGAGLTTPTSGMTFIIIPHATNAASATLKVDSMSAIPLQTFDSGFASGYFNPGNPYTIMYRSAAAAWIVFDQAHLSFWTDLIDDTVAATAKLTAPTGTTMMFLDAAVPSGWTQNSSFNDKVLRLRSSGAGGGTGGSWTISGLTMPHTHSVFGTTDVPSAGQADIADTGSGTLVSTSTHVHNFSVTSAFGSTSAVSSDAVWRPAYTDSIVGDKT
jgi:hypothetical protein